MITVVSHFTQRMYIPKKVEVNFQRMKTDILYIRTETKRF